MKIISCAYKRYKLKNTDASPKDKLKADIEIIQSFTSFGNKISNSNNPLVSTLVNSIGNVISSGYSYFYLKND
jgi:hypothetical protein